MSARDVQINGLRDRLVRHVDVLVELIGERSDRKPEGLAATRRYLRDTLAEMGAVVWDQPFDALSRPGINLGVSFDGTKRERGALVIGAHYDTAIGTPGADDNASSVAILLEIVRSLRTVAFRRAVHCVFYDCEEPPHFAMGEMGSQHHARSMSSRSERLMGMICLESLGYFVKRPRPTGMVPAWLRPLLRAVGGRNVFVVSNTRSVVFATRFNLAFARSGRFPFLPVLGPVRWFPELALSDHRGYWEQGFRALMVTDSAFLRNPNYHTPADTISTLDFDRMTRLAHQLCRTITRLAA